MNHQAENKTYFADPTRATAAEIKETLKILSKDRIIHTVLESLNGLVLILNKERQILAANQELLDGLKRKSDECMIGLRPGEAFNCIHFTKGPGGCDTSMNCRHCGAVLSILAAQAIKQPIKDECKLTVLHDGKLQAAEFAVKVTPLVVQDSELLIFTLNDISNIKRKDTLQSLFNHDYMNILSGLEGWTELLKQKKSKDAAKEIMALILRLKTDFQFFNQLYQAENNHLHVDWTIFKLSELVDELLLLINNNISATKNIHVIAPDADKISIKSDRSLLLRILINMIKNACEHTPDQQMVSIQVNAQADWLIFKVKNPGFIPKKNQGKIFQRTFSTKRGAGHGLGTFSMKLFGESFLKGRISFVSNKKEGTVFVFALPLQLNNAKADSGYLNDGITIPPAAEKTKRKDNTKPVQSSLKKQIVLIEDEPQLLKLGQLLLEGLHYQVISYSDPIKALNYLINCLQLPDLVITDNNMPGLNGLVLAEKILKIKPDLKILLTTGLFEDDLQVECQRIGILAVLTKPFELKTLSETILQLINQ
jgi:signal transduction histidine kinase/CheY-like chemotaxis protein